MERTAKKATQVQSKDWIGSNHGILVPIINVLSSGLRFPPFIKDTLFFVAMGRHKKHNIFVLGIKSHSRWIV